MMETASITPTTEQLDSKLGFCEVCTITTAKYTCPRCEVKTCSLKCSNIHKKELECDGNRDRTKFIPMNKFSNLDLSSDYRLLEEISRNMETCKKMNYDLRNYKPTSLNLHRLREVAKFNKTNLKFLPARFQRRKNNKTRLEKNNVIYWHIQWVFVNANGLKISDDNVCETTKISSLLHKYFTDEADDRLQHYHAVGQSGVRVYLRAEGKPGRKYYELDASSTIQQCLRGKAVIEFPEIHVVLSAHGCGFDVIDSDDEGMDIENAAGNKVIDTIIKKSESNESIYLSLKNLMFVSDNSDMDE